jgi:hypothetical protein
MKRKTNMRRLGLCVAFTLLAACSADEGERCNPLQFSDNGSQGNCSSGLACVYPTAPNCGVAYCCTVDSNGNITDKNPNCQPDPSLDSVCMIDLGGTPGDGGTHD